MHYIYDLSWGQKGPIPNHVIVLSIIIIRKHQKYIISRIKLQNTLFITSYFSYFDVKSSFCRQYLLLSYQIQKVPVNIPCIEKSNPVSAGQYLSY